MMPAFMPFNQLRNNRAIAPENERGISSCAARACRGSECHCIWFVLCSGGRWLGACQLFCAVYAVLLSCLARRCVLSVVRSLCCDPTYLQLQLCPDDAGALCSVLHDASPLNVINRRTYTNISVYKMQ